MPPGFTATSADDDGIVGQTKKNDKSGISGFGGIGVSGVGNAGVSAKGVGNGAVALMGSVDVSEWLRIPAGIPGRVSAVGYGVSATVKTPTDLPVTFFHSPNTLVGVVGSVEGNAPGIGVLGLANTEGYQPTGVPVGVFGAASVGGLAVHFQGNVQVTGDIIFLNTAGLDLAEGFTTATEEDIEAGSVLVIEADGNLQLCRRPYDNRVAGVVSGAGKLRPAIVLGHRPSVANLPIALAGRAYCKVDASLHPIAVGDLLTTSSTPGHAMKAADRDQAFGAVIGKAMSSLESGTGLIPILIALQ
jgi:hypothetical protein